MICSHIFPQRPLWVGGKRKSMLLNIQKRRNYTIDDERKHKESVIYSYLQHTFIDLSNNDFTTAPMLTRDVT